MSRRLLATRSRWQSRPAATAPSTPAPVTGGPANRASPGSRPTRRRRRHRPPSPQAIARADRPRCSATPPGSTRRPRRSATTPRRVHSGRARRPRQPQQANAACFTCAGTARPCPTNRTGPTRTWSVPRDPVGVVVGVVDPNLQQQSDQEGEQAPDRGRRGRSPQRRRCRRRRARRRREGAGRAPATHSAAWPSRAARFVTTRESRRGAGEARDQRLRRKSGSSSGPWGSPVRSRQRAAW